MTYGPWLGAATILGSAHAAVSLFWVLGSTWLLGTVGGSIEQWGRDGGSGVRLALTAVVAAKIAAVVVLWLAVRRGDRVERLLAWTAGTVLTVYGGVLTIAGFAIVTLGAVDVPDGADTYALRWHAYFWDPWFLLWGVSTLVVLRMTRDR